MAVQTGQEIKTVTAWPGFGSGLRKDLPFTKIPDNAVWDSLNVIFDKDSAIKRGGYALYTTVDTWVRLIDEWYDSSNNQWLIIATTDKIYSYNVASATLTDRTPVGGLHGIPGSGYSGIGFYGKYFLTTGQDQPIYWDGVTALFTVLSTAGAPVKAVCVMAFADHLMWFNVQDPVTGLQPQEIIWSDSKNGLVYNAGDAAAITLEDTNDNIVGVEFVINYLIIARGKSIYTSFFIGFPLFYQFNRSVEKYGLVATSAIKKTEIFVLVFASNNVIGFDGANLDAYVGQQIKDDILTTVLQSTFAGGSFSIFDLTSIKWRLFVSDRSDGAPDVEYSYSEPFRNWSKHKYAVPITAIGSFKSGTFATWNQLTSGWNTSVLEWDDPLVSSISPAILYGDNTGKIYINQSSANDNGQSVNAFFNTKPSELTMPGWIKELNRLQFVLAKQTTGKLTIHVFESDDGVNFIEAPKSPYTLDMTKSIISFVDIYAVGDWFYLQVVNNNLNETFDIREIRASFIPLSEMLEY